MLDYTGLFAILELLLRRDRGRVRAPWLSATGLGFSRVDERFVFLRLQVDNQVLFVCTHIMAVTVPTLIVVLRMDTGQYSNWRHHSAPVGLQNPRRQPGGA